MIILSAMVACLCLIVVVACIATVGIGMDDGYLSHDSIENALWAQDCALKHAASVSSSYSWSDRAIAADRFMKDSAPALNSLSLNLQAHGVAYRFALNESFAADYLNAHPASDTENIGGVLVQRSGAGSKIYGCAYDVSMSDDRTSYGMSQIAMFG